MEVNGTGMFLAATVIGHESISDLNDKIGKVYKKSKFRITSTAIIKGNLNSESNVRLAGSVDCNFVLTD